jgi:thiamine kinase-like enzyme
MSEKLRQIVQKLTPQLGEAEGEPRPLEGGITNRNYLVTLGGKAYVVRLPGKKTELLGIDRVGERQANESAAELGLAPPVAAMLTDPPCLVTEFIEGTEMSEEDLRDPGNVSVIAPSLRRLHDSGAELPTDFDSFRVVEDYAQTAADGGTAVPAAYEDASKYAQEIEAALSGPEHDPVPCHNDLLAANFLRDSEQIWIVDWEYAGMGDRYFDLGNFSVNNELDEPGRASLLEAYFGEPPTERQLATLSLMMFMSDFREAMWGVVQTAVSELDFDFEDYAAKHFARLRESAADPRFAARLEEARAATG